MAVFLILQILLICSGAVSIIPLFCLYVRTSIFGSLVSVSVFSPSLSVLVSLFLCLCPWLYVCLVSDSLWLILMSFCISIYVSVSVSLSHTQTLSCIALSFRIWRYINFDTAYIYCMSKKSILYSKLPYTMGEKYLDILYISSKQSKQKIREEMKW